MTKFASLAAVAVLLSGGAVLSAQASDGRIQVAQLNSPGDGLDGDAASQGNGRPNRMGAPMARQKPMMMKTTKKRRVRH